MDALLGLLILLLAGGGAWLLVKVRRAMSGGPPRRLPNPYPPCGKMTIEVPGDHDRTVEVESESAAGRYYRTNPHKLTCTCPDWERRAGERPEGSLDRVCKHLARALVEAGTVGSGPLRAILSERRRPHCFHQPADDVVFGFTPGKDWIDVYARDIAGDFARFGYSLAEARWAYGKSPADEERIVDLIDGSFRL